MMNRNIEKPDSTSTGGMSPNEDNKRCESVMVDNMSGEEGSIESGSGRVPKKFITTWRHACDKTKDRTRDLFKRWRTLPESSTDNCNGPDNGPAVASDCSAASDSEHGWSVHVWATWVKRYESDDEEGEEGEPAGGENVERLTTVQQEKLRHLFSQLLDTDHDQLVTVHDFDAFCQRLKHFADWSENSPEFITLQQVKEGFIQQFIPAHEIDGKRSKGNHKPISEVISLEDWLNQWGKLLDSARNMTDFPVWLQYLPKIIYQAINVSGTGTISRDELSAFYSALLGLTKQDVNDLLEQAYKAMTANEEHPLSYSVYRLCFANFLLGRYPNGPGQYVFGHIGKHIDSFPIDYSAMNTPLNELEQYTPDRKTNRRSVIV